MVYFEKIADSISSFRGQYERDRGIETLSVEIIAGRKDLDWAVYEGKKSDGTSTVFWAYKNKRSGDDTWRWICPSKNHIEGLNKLIEMYREIDHRNKSSRESARKRISDYMENKGYFSHDFLGDEADG